MNRFILPLLLLVELAIFLPAGGVSFDSWSAFSHDFAIYAADLIPQAAPVLLLAFGMTLVMMTGGIDLSVASMAALVACVMSGFDGGTSFWFTAVPLGLVVGLGLGLGNGVLVAGLNVPPIIATLGTMTLYRGLCYVVMGDSERAPFYDVPGYARFGEFTAAAALVIVLYAVGGTWFRLSAWRRQILMTGGNRVAARYAGIPVGRRTCEVYVLTGCLAFLAALCTTARNGSISASSLTGLELQVIVAVVLGGTVVTGGYGSLAGTFCGVLLVAVLDEGLRSAAWTQEDFPFDIGHLRFVLLGVLLAGGVWLNSRPFWRGFRRLG